MFDLEEAITKWTQSVAASDSLLPDDAIELESHLRDLVSELVTRDLSEKEAYLVATQRLGSVCELEREFSKVNASTVWRKRFFWMIAGSLAVTFGNAVVGSATAIASTLVAVAGLGGTATGFTNIIVTIIGWCVLCFVAWRCSKKYAPGPDRSSSVLAICIVVAAAIRIGVDMGGRHLRFGVLSQEELSQSLIVNAYGSFGIHVFLVAASLVLMWKLSDKQETDGLNPTI